MTLFRQCEGMDDISGSPSVGIANQRDYFPLG